MVLKQRFADGRTNYKYIGDDWMLIQQNESNFEMILGRNIPNDEMRKDCIAFVCYEKNEEPIFKDFPQWIYSNDGQLFMSLTF